MVDFSILNFLLYEKSCCDNKKKEKPVFGYTSMRKWLPNWFIQTSVFISAINNSQALGKLTMNQSVQSFLVLYCWLACGAKLRWKSESLHVKDSKNVILSSKQRHVELDFSWDGVDLNSLLCINGCGFKPVRWVAIWYNGMKNIVKLTAQNGIWKMILSNKSDT